jgi:FkbH-like protein
MNRVAQLTQKTNQFNLSTRRYTEQQIASMAEDPGWGVYSIRVRDRFGDNGLVGVAIASYRETQCEIDTLLLSCRVIGRTVETALLSALADNARHRGLRSITGWFIATKQNEPAKNFYSSHGFTCTATDGPRSLWELDLDRNPIRRPEWIQLSNTVENGRSKEAWPS